MEAVGRRRLPDSWASAVLHPTHGKTHTLTTTARTDNVINPLAPPFTPPSSSNIPSLVPCNDSQPTPPPKISWRTTCFGSSKLKESRKLSYVTPRLVDSTPHASCLKSEIKKGALVWKNCLLGSIVGLRAHIPTLRNHLLKVWNIKNTLKLSLLGNGVIAFLFGDEGEKMRVLDAGPWFIAGHILVLKERKQGAPNLDFTSIPLWIRLPELPFEFWTTDSLSRIDSIIGSPLMMDEVTADQTRFGFAKICVELSEDYELPDNIWVDVEGESPFQQLVSYEWKPPRCSSCQKLFHTAKDYKLAILTKLEGKMKMTSVAGTMSGSLDSSSENARSSRDQAGAWTVVNRKKKKIWIKKILGLSTIHWIRLSLF